MTTKSKKPVTKMATLEQSNNEEEQQQLMISEAAYYRAENRGFMPDHELEDWLEAEKQVKEMIHAARNIQLVRS